jgi:copper chaperone
MAAQVHEFKVAMTCTGCSSSVEKVLDKLKGQGVESVKILLEEQTVLVTSTLPADQLLETIKKTGKETTYVGVKQ